VIVVEGGRKEFSTLGWRWNCKQRFGKIGEKGRRPATYVRADAREGLHINTFEGDGFHKARGNWGKLVEPPGPRLKEAR